jgi:hypothetical protein
MSIHLTLFKPAYLGNLINPEPTDQAADRMAAENKLYAEDLT